MDRRSSRAGSAANRSVSRGRGRLSSAATNGVYSVCLPNEAEGNGYGSARPASSLPWEMPWRLVILGDSPGAIVESTLVTDVSALTEVADKAAFLKVLGSYPVAVI